MEDIRRKCGLCGKVFTPYRNNQKYCSEKCRDIVFKNYKQRTKRPIEDHVCEQCGVTFSTSISNKRFCSHTCYELAKAGGIYYTRIEPTVRKCLHCGTK